MHDFPTMDPELAAALAALPPSDLSNLARTRDQLGRLIDAVVATISWDGVELRVLRVPGDGEDSPDVIIHFLTPTLPTSRALPVLLWMHGGGFAIGSAAGSDPFCVEVVRSLGIAVANVEYRLAPETPFPGPLNDCFAALQYVHAHANELGLDPDAIAVGGQSAGGGLAAGTVLRARDESSIPIAFQLLDIPELDDRLSTRSATDFVNTPGWHRHNALLSWKYYLGPTYEGPESPSVSPFASPSRASDFSSLPPTYISTMELDPLRDEGIAYALSLLHAGVSVELHSFPGTFHGSGFIPGTAITQRAGSELLGALERGLTRQRTPRP